MSTEGDITGGHMDASMDGHTNGTPVVTATEVTRRYGEGETAVDALRGVSLAVFRGELVAVMGPSGSGKSTLMHILAALDTPTSGTVSIGGQNVARLNDRQGTLLRPKHLRLPFLNPVAIPTRRGERRPAALDRRRETGEGVPRGPTQAPGSLRPAEPPTCRAIGWPAAAGCDRPRARVAADRGPRGRADRQPRLRHEPRDPRAAPLGDRGLWPDDGHGHPRRGGGGDRRPNPVPERRFDRRRASAQRGGGDPLRDQRDLRLTT